MVYYKNKTGKKSKHSCSLHVAKLLLNYSLGRKGMNFTMLLYLTSSTIALSDRQSIN